MAAALAEAVACYDELKGLDWSFSRCRRQHDQSAVGPGGMWSPTRRIGQVGVKRSLLTEAHGIPLSVVVAGANVNDHKLLTRRSVR